LRRRELSTWATHAEFGLISILLILAIASGLYSMF